MLVEDDNNLREIYEARLQAEGYEIVSARDGEEALVVAKNEHPDLIISDVMMPKISGFEMLDILRNTDGLKDVRVVMLTALGQADDKDRADKLGADRYLVKSQVTLEDIVKSAHDLLGGDAPASPVADPETSPPPPEPTTPASPAGASTPAAPAPTPSPSPSPAKPTATVADSIPVTPAPPVTPPDEKPAAPTAGSPATTESKTPNDTPNSPLVTQTAAEEQANIQAQINNFVGDQPTASGTDNPAAQPQSDDDATHDQIMTNAVNDLVASAKATNTPQAPSSTQPAAASPDTTQPSVGSSTPGDKPAPQAGDSDKDSADGARVANKKVIQPINNGTSGPDLNTLLAKEEAKEEALKNTQNPNPKSQNLNGANPNDIAL